MGYVFTLSHTTWLSNVCEEKAKEVVVEVGSVKCHLSFLIGLFIWCSQTLVENLQGTEWVKYELLVAILLTLQTKTRGHQAKIMCAHCQNPSPRVFELSWACLIPKCPMFWIQIGGKFDGQSMPDNLDYHPSFLDLPPSQPLPPGFESVGHAKDLKSEMDSISITTSYAFSRGYHCGECRRLSCRYVSDSWLW